MVFAAAKLAGWLVPPARAQHVATARCSAPTRRCSRRGAGTTCRSCRSSTKRARARRRHRREEPRARRGDAERGRAPGRHRRAEVRRPQHRSHEGLRLRLGSHARVRGEHRAVPAVRARAHPVDPAQARGVGARRDSTRRRSRSPSRPSARSPSSSSTCRSPCAPWSTGSSRTSCARTSLARDGVHVVLREVPGAQSGGRRARRASRSPT